MSWESMESQVLDALYEIEVLIDDARHDVELTDGQPHVLNDVQIWLGTIQHQAAMASKAVKEYKKQFQSKKGK